MAEATNSTTGVRVSIREARQRGRSRATFPILTVTSFRSRSRRGIFADADPQPMKHRRTAHALHARCGCYDQQNGQFDRLHHHTRRVLSAPLPDLSKTLQTLSVAAASASALARPMPREAPVTS